LIFEISKEEKNRSQKLRPHRRDKLKLVPRRERGREKKAIARGTRH
jgi:hypothetical protein